MPLVQLVPGGRGPDRLGGVGLTAVPDELLRGACEAAVLVARSLDGSQVPRSLRPYVKMQRLHTPALAPIRRVLEEDEAFRASVAEVASEDAIGRESWLFLNRPEGWEGELEAMASTLEAAGAAEAEERAERTATRKVAALEARVAELQRRLDEANAALAEAESRVAAERDRRAAAEAAAADATRTGDALRHERDDARARLGRAESRVADLQEQAAATEALRAAEAPAPDTAVVPAEPRAAGVDVDVPALAATVAAAAEAADALRQALADAAAVLGGLPPSTAAASSLPDHPSSASRPQRVADARPTRRAPVRLPLGMFDDSPEAASHLVRVPGMLLLVDGYNCTLRDDVLAGLPIPEQRRRLVDALAELATRTGVDVEVVFDGGDVGTTPAALSPMRRGVRVRFSPRGVEADDDVLERVRRLPPDRPVVVASSDNRVRDGAAAQGANVISAEQLVALVRARR